MSGAAGPGALMFPGRIGGRALGPGSYTLIATLRGGNSVRAPFAILP